METPEEDGFSESDSEERPGVANGRSAANPVYSKPPPANRLFARIRSLNIGRSPSASTEVVSVYGLDGKAGTPSVEGLDVHKRGSKSTGNRLAAAVKKRISSKSAEANKPKTWEEYNRCYGNVSP